MIPWLTSDLLKSGEVNGVDKVYSMASVYDPMYTNRFSYQHNDLSCRAIMELAANKNAEGETWAHRMREEFHFPLNFVFTLKQTGEIGYAMTGKFPVRRYNAVQGSYAKIGWLPKNEWQGFVPWEDHAYVINPEQGFISSANNMVTSEFFNNGISYSLAFPHRAVRITELIQETIDSGRKMTPQ